MEELVATVYGSQLSSVKQKITDSKQKLQTSSHLKVSLPGLAITQQKLSEQQQSKANKKFNLESEARYIVTPGSNNVRQASKYILRSVPRMMQSLAAQLTNYDENMAIIEWQKFAPLRDWAQLADFAQLS